MRSFGRMTIVTGGDLVAGLGPADGFQGHSGLELYAVAPRFFSWFSVQSAEPPVPERTNPTRAPAPSTGAASVSLRPVLVAHRLPSSPGGTEIAVLILPEFSLESPPDGLSPPMTPARPPLVHAGTWDEAGFMLSP